MLFISHGFRWCRASIIANARPWQLSFDPDRFPFLEGRSVGSKWREDPATPLPINDQTVLFLLDAIQIFRGRTISYKGLDVEQIGHVYEGLLEKS